MLKIKDKNKFIIYNYTPNDISDLKLFELIYRVIQQGKISNNETQYCYLTILDKDLVVDCRKTKTGYRFNVYNDKTIELNVEKGSDGNDK